MRTINIVLMFILSVLSVLLLCLLYVFGIFPIVYRVIIIFVIFIFLFISWIKTVYYKKKMKQFLKICFNLILIILLVYIDYFIIDVTTKWNKIYTLGHNISAENIVDTNQEAFTIYISGNDNTDNITEASRSDVNILMTINPKTKKILLTNTPRDAYIYIDGDDDKGDKLTHASIYGVDAAKRALETLYDINIDYFVKFNFSSFVDIIKATGGIEVYSETDFTAYGGANFTEGLNQVNGDEALQFVRERYSFSDGDISRGKHQQEIIMSFFKKMTSVSNINNMPKILDAFENNIVSNIPTKSVFGIFNATIDNFTQKWDIQSQTVYGEGHMDLPSYAAPNLDLYTMKLDNDIVDEAKQKINDIILGR